jgi:hypothetical protein
MLVPHNNTIHQSNPLLRTSMAGSSVDFPQSSLQYMNNPQTASDYNRAHTPQTSAFSPNRQTPIHPPMALLHQIQSRLSGFQYSPSYNAAHTDTDSPKHQTQEPPKRKSDVGIQGRAKRAKEEDATRLDKIGEPSTFTKSAAGGDTYQKQVKGALKKVPFMRKRVHRQTQHPPEFVVRKVKEGWESSAPPPVASSNTVTAVDENTTKIQSGIGRKRKNAGADARVDDLVGETHMNGAGGTSRIASRAENDHNIVDVRPKERKRRVSGDAVSVAGSITSLKG